MVRGGHSDGEHLVNSSLHTSASQSDVGRTQDLFLAQGMIECRRVRSPEAQIVSTVLRDLADRGTFYRLVTGRMRIARMKFTMLWHHNRMYELVLDLDAGALLFRHPLAGINPDPSLLKALKSFLRSLSSDQAPANVRIDADKCNLQLLVHRRRVVLAMTVKKGEYEYCVRRLVIVAHRLLTEFVQNITG